MISARVTPALAFRTRQIVAAPSLRLRRHVLSGRDGVSCAVLKLVPSRSLSTESSRLDEEDLEKVALAQRAHREVQVSRRRRREAEDEFVLYRCAEQAGFGTSEDNARDAADCAARRRNAISKYLSSQAEVLISAAFEGRKVEGIANFALEVAPSRDLPQPIAGDGVFLKSAGDRNEVPAGTVLAFYPGSVYMPHEVRWLGGYGPTLSKAGQTTSSHVIGRVGGVRIDGLWSGIEVPFAEYNLDDGAIESAVDRLGLDVDNITGREAAHRDASMFCRDLKWRAPIVPDHGGIVAEVRRLNPLAVGEMINHPPCGGTANVLGWPVDLQTLAAGAPAGRERSFPNAYALRPEKAVRPGAPCPYTVVMVAARAIGPGEELYLDYGCELLPIEDIPIWFTPASLRGDDAASDPVSKPALAIQEELYAWRDQFQRNYGRKPSREDLELDPVASGLFGTFQKLRKLGDL